MDNLLKKHGRLIGITVVINFIITVVLIFIIFPELDAGDRSYIQALRNPGVGEYDLTIPDSPIVDIVEQVNSAVVSIVVTKDVPVFERYYEEYSPFGSPFSFQVPRQRQEGTQEQKVGGGSGFIVSSDGLVVTNKHVVSEEDAMYTAFTSEGDQYELELIARDPFVDIAVLRIVGAVGLPHLQFGDSSTLKAGQTVVAIGNALGEFRNSVSVGVVSGLSRSVVAGGVFGEREQLEDVIQTDAAINPGNSGGPLLDIAGRVIGMNVAVALGSENIGFALPSNIVRDIIESVQKHGEIIRPYLGVRYALLTEQMAQDAGLSVDHGALLLSGSSAGNPAIVPNSPADRAGLQENDIILSIDGEDITVDNTLSSIIRAHDVGDTLELEILRGDRRIRVEVELARAPSKL